ncbi:non-structural maintenance of chromosomes element 4 homolog A-like [Dermacentor albipictus]|uniref:non-structural maintenance of chromosomes element 4 homolog A-like n=1 Tax=Dermacentor albipictus TaxID=60249 RepID=UPI0038FC451D
MSRAVSTDTSTPTTSTLSNSPSPVTMSQASDAGGSEPQGSSGSQDATPGHNLRHAYRTVIDRQVVEEEKLPANDALLTAEDLFKDVTHAPEAVLDSDIVSVAASRGLEQAASLPLNLSMFEPEHLAARVRDLVLDTSDSPTGPLTEEAWAKLGKLAEGTTKTSQPFWYVHGSADDAPVKTKQAPVERTVEDTPDRAPTVPQQVSSVEQTNQETTTGRVGVIHQLLKDLYNQTGEPIPYFEFVLHPQSFAKTCENIFHLSFLVNEGHARIKPDEFYQVVVEPVFGNTSAEREANESGVFMMTMTMKKWQDAVRALNLTEPVIPD